MYYNVWIGCSTVFLDWYKDNKDEYPQLQKVHDVAVVQRLFREFTAGGKTYKLFSLYLNNSQAAQDLFDKLQTNFPQDFAIVGVWHMDGRQAGTQWELDGEGVPTGNVTGTPAYPIHAQAYRFMPDIVEYDENGDVVSTTPASSNADLRDINILQADFGMQAPRRFS